MDTYGTHPPVVQHIPVAPAMFTDDEPLPATLEEKFAKLEQRLGVVWCDQCRDFHAAGLAPLGGSTSVGGGGADMGGMVGPGGM